MDAPSKSGGDPSCSPSSQFNNHRSIGNNVALGLIGGTFAATMALTTPFVVTQLRSALPYMATPRSKVERALKFIASRRRKGMEVRAAASPAADEPSSSARAAATATAIRNSPDERGNLNFVDLGSGDGTAVLSAASLGWTATGVELNPTLWLVSSIRRWLSLPSPDARARSMFVMGDMFAIATARERLRSADCVMIFGVKPLMPRVADLVSSNCRRGCFLMSYRFRVPLLVAKNGRSLDDRGELVNVKSEAGALNATLIYDEEEMRIYVLE